VRQKLILIGIASFVLCSMMVVPLTAQVTYSTPEAYQKATGKKIETFNEAPTLRTKVAAGEIPLIEQRLPEEPLIVEPMEQIGKYGGTVHLTTMGSPLSYYINEYWLTEPPLQHTTDQKSVYPNVAKGYKASDDYTTFTLFLRKGLKWSDGVPVTADDVMFWYEDILLNNDLTPIKPKQLIQGGKLVKVEKVDDYTVRFRFPRPYFSFPGIALSPPQQASIFQPKHYLKKYHIRYNPKANELAKEEGFDYWYQLFNQHGKWASVAANRGPSLEAWIVKEITTDHAVLERNPYYWKIDTAGNQLPYIDKIIVRAVGDRESYKMSVIGGETDFALSILTIEDYPLLKKNEERGGYKVYLWKKESCASVAYFPYQTYEDPVMRKILQDIRFRKALSLAINREEINKLIYFGKGTPGQCSIPPGSKYYVPEYWRYYAEYDPERANRLLDEMGLKWNKEHTYRLRPDGKPLFIKIEGFSQPETPTIATAKLVRDYWGKIGIKVDFDFSNTSRFITRFRANKVSVTTHWVELMPEVVFNGTIWHSHEWWCKPWMDAYLKGGRVEAEKEGVPEDVIKYFELIEEFRNATSEQKRIEISHEINRLWTTNLRGIGTVGGSIPAPCVVSNHLHNVPKTGFSTWFVHFQEYTLPAQYYLSK